MKKSAFFILSILFLATSFIGCRENKEEEVMTQEEALIEEMKDDNADIKTKIDGEDSKIKMETDSKEVKIKTEDGETKIKVTETDDNQ